MSDTTPPRRHRRPPRSTTTGADRHEANRWRLWLMVFGCCLAVPLALVIAGVTAGGLAGAGPWLLGAGAVLAVALVVVHGRSTLRGCEPPALRTGPQPNDAATPYSARMPSDDGSRTIEPWTGERRQH